MQQNGPSAPRDPHRRGSKLYFFFKTDIEASPRPDGRPADEIYLDCGRLKEKLRMMNAGIAGRADLLNQFDTAAGFRAMVEGIGVSFENTAAAAIGTELQFYGKTSRYTSGLHLHTDCPTDGSETLFWMDEQPFTGDEEVAGQFRFVFPRVEMTAKATVIFYLKPGYDIPEPQLEEPVCFASEAYQQMIARSLMSTGNNARLKAALAKAANGQPIHLAFIGGSITQGAGAKPIHTAGYPYLAWKGLEKLVRGVGSSPITYTKAGIGGTPSELGMLRLERDLLAHGAPDIVVIEFAVNDEDDETKGRCYESLVRKALALPGGPAVVLLFSVFSNDWNLQGRLSPVGRYYALPMVSVLDAVSPQFGKPAAEGGVISKRQYFYDTFHPTNEGHRVMADCLLHLFATVLAAKPDAAQPLPEKPLLGRVFDSVRLLDRDTPPEAFPGVEIDPGSFTARDEELQCVERDADFAPTPQFTGNWLHKTGEAPFTLTLTCKSLLVIAKDSGDDLFGRAEFLVDGKPGRVIDPHEAGWTHCNAKILLEGDEPCPHTVTVRMLPEDTGKHFTILGFGIC